jgi:hypothetical protein
MTFMSFDAALIKKMGITDLAGILTPIIVDNEDSVSVFIKFMSDGGQRDEEQGLAFRALLDKEHVAYDQGSQIRTFRWVDKQGLEQLVGLPIW